MWAKDDDGDIRGFIVERDFGGFETPKIEGKCSLRASVTGMIQLDDVKVGGGAERARSRSPSPKTRPSTLTSSRPPQQVPAANLLPHAKGLGAPFACLLSARYGISWGAMGAAEACLDVARSYVERRCCCCCCCCLYYCCCWAARLHRQPHCAPADGPLLLRPCY